jgi:ribosomal protein L19
LAKGRPSWQGNQFDDLVGNLILRKASALRLVAQRYAVAEHVMGNSPSVERIDIVAPG